MRIYPMANFRSGSIKVPTQKIYAIGHEPEVLTRIYDARIKLCILQRRLDPAVSVYAAFLQQACSSLTMTECVDLQNIFHVLQNILPQHEMRAWFIDDVATLVDMFCCLFDLDQIGLRLLVLDKVMCPRFHADKVPCRLVTTYAGKGTEWLDVHGADRLALMTGNEYRVEQHVIQSLDKGDVALLKGDGWEGNEGGGMIHRSPSPNENESRVLLTLDFV